MYLYNFYLFFYFSLTNMTWRVFMYTWSEWGESSEGSLYWMSEGGKEEGERVKGLRERSAILDSGHIMKSIHRYNIYFGHISPTVKLWVTYSCRQLPKNLIVRSISLASHSTPSSLLLSNSLVRSCDFFYDIV